MKFELAKMKMLWFFLLAVFTLPVFSQEKSISGIVSDASTKEPLVGVTVQVAGTTNGAATDFDGKFTLKVSPGQKLIISFVGYVSQTIVTGQQSAIKIALVPQTQGLDEVVVIGYGTVKKNDATGAVSTVSSKDFAKGGITSPQDLIVGKSAGTVITSSGGAPGSGATIRIRGGSSMSASNDPLIIIDGFPVSNSGISGLANPLTTINPNDIETFTVLKDASATAIYGSRASNGVILITTKKGSAGKPMKIEYNGTMSVNTIPAYMDVLSGDEVRSMAYDLASKSAVGLSMSSLGRLGKENTNWQKQIYQNALAHDHNISMSGGIKTMPYRASLGYTNQNGILKTTNMERSTLAIGLDPTFLDNHLKVSVNLKGSYTKQNFGDQGAVGSAVFYDPTQPVMNGNTKFGGYYTWVNLSDVLADGSMDPNGSPNPIGVSNPVALLNQTDNKSTVQRSLGNVQLDYKFHFLPELRANLNLGYDYFTTKGHNNATNDAAFTFRNGTGRKNDYSQTGKSQLLDFYLNYVKEIKSINSKIDATGGYSWQHFYKDGSSFVRNGDETQISDNSTFINENYLVSFFGRLNYTLLDRYLLTVTIRDDGSSRFAEANRWGLFPAAALAWKIKDESFLKNVNAISDLKLRLGWGITGQQDIGNDFPYLPVYRESTATAQYQFGNTFYKTMRPNPYDANIKWEQTTTYNVGLDFGFMKNRITGSIDAYKRETKDLLNFIPIAAGSNFSNFLTTNVGNLENKGIEFSISGQIIQSKNLNWSVGFNAAYNENKITKLTKTDDPNYPGVDVGLIGGGVGNFIQNQRVGFPANSFFVFQQVYGSNGMPIEGLYVDRTGTGGTITSNNLNKYHYKKPAPDYTLGINSRIEYKKFDFSFSGRANIGNYVYNNVASGALYSTVYNQSGFFNNLPRLINNAKFTNTQYFSDFYIENASFFRMDNMSVGYNLEKFLKARLSLTVQNAFTITKYKGLDPEVNGGIDNNFYPRPRVYVLGVNLTF
ncbi:MAG: TonB-dependent receptor [Prolixibacteraceae bacterium]|jgi:iron complex outermembrane receptor protein|nr:TonB-dependent receptor [Prolixibacteraceae bacterium]